MADYNSDRTGSNIDFTLDKVDVRDTVINIGSNTTNRVTVGSAGNVGIGTSEPNYKLEVNHTGDDKFAIVTNDEGNVASETGVYFRTTTKGALGVGTGASLAFEGGGTERARIDSSGTLLVGTTSTSWLTSAGHRIFNNGSTTSTVTSGVVGSFNRLTSDGDIVQFRKDGTTVGSIRSRSGAVSTIILDPRAGGSGLTGTEGGIYPVNNEGGAADGLINLGLSNQRFKDLHLSGGVYLGGTGAANKLDDYETGSFTVTNNGDSTGTFAAEDAQYTKIGRLVTVQIVFDVGTSFTSSVIGGLPFVAANLVGVTSVGQNTSVLCSNKASETIYAAVIEGTSTIQFSVGDSSTAHSPNSGQNVYRLQLSYIAS